MYRSVKRNLMTFLFAALMFLFGIMSQVQPVDAAAQNTTTIRLSATQTTMRIGDEKYLTAYTSTGKKATFKSSKSSIVSVNASGKMTAKSSGTAVITAKCGNAQAACRVTVEKTKITINANSVSIEKKGSYRLRAAATSYSQITWKSSNPRIATVSATGIVNGIRPGQTTITASANGTTVSCRVTVKTPIVKLNKSSVTLKPGQAIRIVATTSNGFLPIWSSSKSSVATVSQNGTITAKKAGTATITANVDGVKKYCTVTVAK